MQLTHLSLTNFRNLSRLELDVPGGVILIVGDNAQGKTSLLEAIYYLAAFSSFHAGHDRQLVNFQVENEPLVVVRIIAEYRYKIEPSDQKSPGSKKNISGNHRLEIRLIQERNGLSEIPSLRKEILLDNVKRKPGEALGSFNAVLFLPQILQVIEGAPDERRRYLNIALSQVVSGYHATLTEYAHVLTQRNALLKLLAERNGDIDQLTFWDEQLAVLGARIMYARIRAIQELDRLSSRAHTQLTRGQETLRLAYQPSYEPLPPAKSGQYQLLLDAPADRTGIALERIQQGYQERLVKLRAEEIARGVTTIGPHRDELRFLSNNINLGVYGSRGQTRTAMLSLKLAEISWMKEKTGQWPVLLLDEVLAELDPTRRADLLSRLGECEQALITTTDLDLFPSGFVRQDQTWRIQEGRLAF